MFEQLRKQTVKKKDGAGYTLKQTIKPRWDNAYNANEHSLAVSVI
jgi:hypothetical protein